MKGLILAAGRGSRMGNLTEDRPKCLVPLRGKSLLDWQLAALRGGGVVRLAAVRGYRGERLEAYGFALFDNPRWRETNMVMSLACASEWLQDEPCIVSYSDIVYMPGSVRALADIDADIAITYDVNWLSLWSLRFDDVLGDAETFRIDSAGRVREIGQRAASVDEIQGQYMGLLRFTPRGWHTIQQVLAGLAHDVRDRLSMTELLQTLIRSGCDVIGVPISTPWGEVDSMEDLAIYERNSRFAPLFG